jgi:hypothetical protein
MLAWPSGIRGGLAAGASGLARVQRRRRAVARERASELTTAGAVEDSTLSPPNGERDITPTGGRRDT